MQFSKQAAIVSALLMLLSACSTVKLDESAPVEDRTGKPVPQITTLPILEDINPSINTPNYDGPDAWKNSNGSDFQANANDIIEWNGTSWNVIFNSQSTTSVIYITNAYTGIQYKWEHNQWTKSFEGIYSKELWRLIL